MVLSVQWVRQRFLFPSGVWDVCLTPEKNCPNSNYCKALICVFALIGASGAENFQGVQRGSPLVGRHVLGYYSIGKSRQKIGKNGKKLRWLFLN
jgi:hypothetical protein